MSEVGVGESQQEVFLGGSSILPGLWGSAEGRSMGVWLLMLGGTETVEGMGRHAVPADPVIPQACPPELSARGHIYNHLGLPSSQCSSVGLENGFGIGQDDASAATFYFSASQSQSWKHLISQNYVCTNLNGRSKPNKYHEVC